MTTRTGLATWQFNRHGLYPTAGSLRASQDLRSPKGDCVGRLLAPALPVARRAWVR